MPGKGTPGRQSGEEKAGVDHTVKFEGSFPGIEASFLDRSNGRAETSGEEIRKSG